MRESFFIRIACLCLVLFLSGESWAQTEKTNLVSLEFKNQPLNTALREFGKVSGYKVNYSVADVSSYKVTVSIRKQNALSALRLILEEKPFTFEVDGLFISVKKTVKSSTPSSQSTKQIKGRVLDENGLSLPGANIRTLDNKQGTITSGRGDFSLTVPENTEELEISFIGLKSEKVNIQGKTYIEVTLNEERLQLQDVVVTGYQTIEKGRATGAFSLLKDEDTEAIYSTDIKQKLEGAAPGLLMNQNNEIEIRGVSSLNANMSPLIVVDGFPMESSSLNLNPNDIEQISILKDAASASIWGIRAANGVIVITTKRGSLNKKPEITYTGTINIASSIHLDDLHILPSDEYASALYEIYQATGVSTNGVSGGYNEIQEIYLQQNAGVLSQAEALNKVKQIGAFSNRKQIEDNFYRKELLHQHTLSIRSGGEKSSTYISLNYDYTRKKEVGNDNNKVNLLVNNDFTLSPKLTLQANVRGTLQEGKQNAVNALFYQPWQRILNDDGTYYNEYTTMVNPVYKEKCEELGMKDWSYNSLQEQRMNNNKNKEMNIVTSLRLSWKPIKGLELSSQANYEYGRSELEQLYAEDHYFTRNLVNTFTEVTLDADGYPASIGRHHIPESGGIKDMRYVRMKSYVFRNTASYDNLFGDFYVKALVGNEIYSYESDTQYSRLWGYKEDMLTVQSVNESSLQSGVKGYNGRTNFLNWNPSIRQTLERYVSTFGTASVSYKERYDLFTSLRLDQTNLLTNSSKYRNNPAWSVGAKWNLRNEPFFKADFVDYLTLRTSYGLSGNIDKHTSPDMVVTSGTDNFLKSINILIITNPANPQLGWEKTYTFNIGTDFSLWRDKLSGSLDFYQKTSKDLLASVQSLDPTTGWASFYKNSATMVNRGIDLALRVNLIKRQNLRWDTHLNFSYNYNKVTRLSNIPTAANVLTYGSPLENQSAYLLMAIHYGGLDEKGEPTFMKANDNTHYNYNELSTLKIEDLKEMGRTTPPVFGSLSSTLKYNDFTFSVMCSYKLGHKMRLPSTTTSTLYTEWFGSRYRWIEGEDNADKWVPRLYTAAATAPNNYINCLAQSDRLVDDADVIRLRSVSVAYDITPFLRLLRLKGGSIRLSGENLCFWAANRYDLDPDYVNSLAVKPSFIGTLNINF